MGSPHKVKVHPALRYIVDSGVFDGWHASSFTQENTISYQRHEPKELGSSKIDPANDYLITVTAASIGRNTVFAYRVFQNGVCLFGDLSGSMHRTVTGLTEELRGVISELNIEFVHGL